MTEKPGGSPSTPQKTKVGNTDSIPPTPPPTISSAPPAPLAVEQASRSPPAAPKANTEKEKEAGQDVEPQEPGKEAGPIDAKATHDKATKEGPTGTDGHDVSMEMEVDKLDHQEVIDGKPRPAEIVDNHDTGTGKDNGKGVGIAQGNTGGDEQDDFMVTGEKKAPPINIEAKMAAYDSDQAEGLVYTDDDGVHRDLDGAELSQGEYKSCRERCRRKARERYRKTLERRKLAESKTSSPSKSHPDNILISPSNKLRPSVSPSKSILKCASLSPIEEIKRTFEKDVEFALRLPLSKEYLDYSARGVSAKGTGEGKGKGGEVANVCYESSYDLPPVVHQFTAPPNSARGDSSANVTPKKGRTTRQAPPPGFYGAKSQPGPGRSPGSWKPGRLYEEDGTYVNSAGRRPGEHFTCQPKGYKGCDRCNRKGFKDCIPSRAAKSEKCSRCHEMRKSCSNDRSKNSKAAIKARLEKTVRRRVMEAHTEFARERRILERTKDRKIQELSELRNVVQSRSAAILCRLRHYTDPDVVQARNEAAELLRVSSNTDEDPGHKGSTAPPSNRRESIASMAYTDDERSDGGTSGSDDDDLDGVLDNDNDSDSDSDTYKLSGDVCLSSDI